MLTWKGNGVSAGKSYGTTTYTSSTIDSRDWARVRHRLVRDQHEKFYVDGVLKYTAPLPADGLDARLHEHLAHHIAYGERPDATKLPSSVQFDYVKYWQKDYYVDDDGPAAGGYSARPAPGPRRR